MRKTCPKLRLATTLVALCSLAPAQAQEPASAPYSEGGGELVIEEVVVTANRRVENLQEVSMSVSAFTGEFLKDSGITDLTSLEQYTPSLSIVPSTDSRSTSIRIRGIGSVGSNSGIDPSVGMFIDGVYQGRAGMSIADLIDIERVEVLRGPQGTLYGKNTAAGAISVITREPATEYESELELVYANNARKEIRGMVNIPLGSAGHAVRMTGFAVKGDHLFENTYTGEGISDANKWGLKSRLLLDGSSTDGIDLGEWLITLDYSKEDTDCCSLAVIEYDGLSTLNSPLTNHPTAELSAELGLNSLGQPILPWSSFADSEGFSTPEPDPFGKDYWFDTPATNKVEVGGVAAQWNYELANEDTATFIGAWRHYQSDSGFDGDFTAYDAVTSITSVELDQYSAELRLTSHGARTVDYQGGLYAYYSEFDSVGIFEMSESLVENMGIRIFFPDGTQNIDTNLYTTTSFAAFGQLTWNVSEKFNATLGLRYTSETKQRKGTQLTTPESLFLDIPPVAGPNLAYDDDRTDEDISPTVNLRYFLDEDVMVYASVSRGFKSGGYNQRRELKGNNGEFDEEIATNYELGWKGTWLKRRLQLNGTFYLVDYDDFQSQSFDGASFRVTNAGSMRSYGAEVEATYLVSQEVTVGTAIGYNKAEYSDFEFGQCTVAQTFHQYYFVNGGQGASPTLGEVCTQNLADRPLDNAPEWTFSSYLQYTTELPANLLGIMRLEHSFIDSLFLDQDLDPVLHNDAINLLNLRFTVTPGEGRWQASLWGRNLLDEEYYAIGLDIPTVGGFAGIVAPGATYGITLRLSN